MEIKAAYRQLQKKCHPDILGDEQGHEMSILLNDVCPAYLLHLSCFSILFFFLSACEHPCNEPPEIERIRDLQMRDAGGGTTACRDLYMHLGCPCCKRLLFCMQHHGESPMHAGIHSAF